MSNQPSKTHGGSEAQVLKVHGSQLTAHSSQLSMESKVPYRHPLCPLIPM
jgi:hypothetical protein